MVQAERGGKQKQWKQEIKENVGGRSNVGAEQNK